MHIIQLFDPAIGSQNLGDEIISLNTNEVLENIKSVTVQRPSLPTQHKPSNKEYETSIKADIRIVGGSNLLNLDILKYRQMKLHPKQLITRSDLILMGVGSWKYQEKINTVTSYYWKRLLNNDFLHSVRDSYTEQKLHEMGFKNVLNTSCQTLWRFKENPTIIHGERSDTVVFTLTDYNRDYSEDKDLVQLLLRSYENILFWPQGPYDLSYLSKLVELETANITVLERTLGAFNAALQGQVDYIGTRLHAGIHALKHDVRCLIIGIDNRAIEISNDVNLLMAKRGEVEVIETFLKNKRVEYELQLPLRAINSWMDQFA